MTRNGMASLVASSVLVLATLDVHAQYPGSTAPGTPPTQAGPVFSPYLNLLRGGNPAINYYGLVRPEVQFRAAVRDLSNELETTQGEVASGRTPAMPLTTGHPVQFFNLSHYYSGTPQGGLSRGAAGNYSAATNYLTGMQSAGGQMPGAQAGGAMHPAASSGRGR